MEEESYIGYMKFHGDLVEDGLMDARKSAQALLGFDEAIRFFVYQQAPDLRKTNFDLPVRIKKGSWEIAIPELVELVKLSGGVIATAYGVKAAQKMAENDFDKLGLKVILKESLQAVQWVIKLGKHLGDLTIKKFSDVVFINNNQLIGIKNSDNEILYIPKKYLDFYVTASPNILQKLSELVENDRSLLVGVYENNELTEESITRKDRAIFTNEEEKDLEAPLFPELEHGQSVVLQGEVTRGNEMSNTMGFAYKGHILTCYPAAGSIVEYKDSLFLKCEIEGSISRIDHKGVLGAKRPKIIFTQIKIIENNGNQSSLF